MSVTLKFLSQAAAKAQNVTVASARLIGEASPKTPKTPVSSPSRFSPFFEEFEHSAKQALSGSPSKRASFPRVPELPSGPRSLDFDKAQKTGGVATPSIAMPLFQQQRWQQQQEQQEQELGKPLQQQGSNLTPTAARQRAAASAAAQQELATSAVPAAELARQSFLARRKRQDASACDPAAAMVGAAEGVSKGSIVTQRASLLGRGEDAAAFPAFDTAQPKLPVLLGQGPGGPRHVPTWDGASEKDIAEQVREAFLARQGRITGRRVGAFVP